MFKKPAIFFILFCFYAASISAAEIKTINYQWLTMGKPTGEQIVNYHDDGRVDISFHFSDRGRGPNKKESIQLDKNGLITQIVISGHSYMGAPVDEKFSLNNGIAHWKNTQEDQKINGAGAKFYMADEGVPQELEFLVRAINKSETKKLQLLPSGTAEYKVMHKAEVTNNRGESKQVSLIAITGLGFSPTYGWFDEDLHLFALDFGWMGMMPAEWVGNLDNLQKIQTTISSNYYKDLAKQFSHQIKDITVINNVNLYTATENKLIKNSQVAIKDGRIVAIGSQVKQFKSDNIIDGKGMTLMPGLWDMHTHISINDGLLNIVNGVTSVRDLANKHEDLLEAIDLFDSGQAIGPKVYKAGFIDQKSPYSAPTGKLVETLEEALAAVDWYAERGYPQIKIYSSITPSWVKPIAERIHHHGMKLSGHIPSFMSTEQAVKDGFDEIQHINMLFLNFLAGKDDDTRTPLRFTLVGDKAGELDFNSEGFKSFIKLLKEKDIIVDPTVTIFQSMYINKAGEIDPGYKSIVDHLPANVARGFLSSELDINQDNEKRYAASSEALLTMIKQLFDAGIRIVAGTDAIAGYTLHRELELYSLAGIPNHEVLKIGTVNAARIAGQKDVGTIEVGQIADLILVDGDPLKDINAIRKVALVFKGSNWFNASEINKAIGIKPFVIY